jgi:hypothetical protein
VGRVTINILVRDESHQAVRGAEIHISRHGRSMIGVPLLDIEGVTDQSGRFVRPNTEFQLTDSPPELVVNAHGFTTYKTRLTNEQLLESFDKGGRLFLPVSLEKHSVPSTPSANVPPQGTPGLEGSSLSQPADNQVSLMILVLVITLLVLAAAAVLAWWLGRRAKFARAYEAEDLVVHHLKDIARTLESLKQEQSASLEQQKELLSEIVKNNEILARGVTVISIHEELSVPFSHIKSGAASPPAAIPHRAENALTSASADGARLSYVGLMNRQPVTPEPIFLEIEESRGIAGKLEDSNVYLSAVSHSQGTFVLFTENGDSGWVFPNPTIGFRHAALRDVFPLLTAGEFAEARENIRPKPARRVEAKRWRIA